MLFRPFVNFPLFMPAHAPSPRRLHNIPAEILICHLHHY